MEVKNIAFSLSENNNEALEKVTHRCCCGGNSTTAPLTVQQSFRAKRQSTTDSGCGSPLDPISERRELYEEPVFDDVNANSRMSSLQQNPCAGHLKHSDVTARLTESAHVHPEETEVLFSRNGPHWSKSACFGMRDSRSGSCASEEQQTACSICGQRRTISESCAGSLLQHPDGILHNGGYETYGDDLRKMDLESENIGVVEKKGKYRRHYFQILLVVICMVSVGVSGIIIYVSKDSQMTRLKDEIEILRESINDRASPSFAEISSRKSEFHPRIHMVLDGRSDMPLDPWNQRVLQWTPSFNEYLGFEYNRTTRYLTVEEQGIYFVYNQIYAFWQTSEPTFGMRNHTIFHTIFKKPFNYPAHQKPIAVAESVLSNCWNENAHSQIHTSYQGFIVKVQERDRLYVGLEEYDQSSETLNARSTFFGAFKL